MSAAIWVTDQEEIALWVLIASIKKHPQITLQRIGAPNHKCIICHSAPILSWLAFGYGSNPIRTLVQKKNMWLRTCICSSPESYGVLGIKLLTHHQFKDGSQKKTVYHVLGKLLAPSIQIAVLKCRELCSSRLHFFHFIIIIFLLFFTLDMLIWSPKNNIYIHIHYSYV